MSAVAGRSRIRGVVDIAMVQSLARRDDIAELTAGYGFVVVDECHHVPREPDAVPDAGQSCLWRRILEGP